MSKAFVKKCYTDTLQTLWRGGTHMHIAFWLCWFVPIYALANAGNWLPGWSIYLATIYILVATVGTWRSTRNPPGQLWAAGVYRLILILFAICCIIFAGMILAISFDITL